MTTVEQFRSIRFRADRLVSLFTVIFILAAGFAIIFRAFKLVRNGEAYPWLHGDWLINRELTEIRRSHIGSWILEISDLLSVSPLMVTFVLQTVLTVLLFYLLISLFLRLNEPLIFSLFVLSPALFVIFWLPYIFAAQRKEMIAFIAILLVLSSCMSRSGAGLLLGAVLLCIGVYGHEANILFLPLFMSVLWVCRESFVNKALYWTSIAIAVFGSLHAFWYAYSHSLLSDAALVCQPVLDRGVRPEVCEGAILWLTEDLDYSLGEVAKLLAGEKWSDGLSEILRNTDNLSALQTLSLIYALTLIPLLFVLGHLQHRWYVIGLALLSTLPFVPLYFVAVDWGRWISMQVFSMMVVTMTLLYSGKTAVVRQPAPAGVVFFTALSFLWVPYVNLNINWLWYEKVFLDILEMLG